MEISPVAYIHTDFKEKFGIPRQSCLAHGCIGRIVFEPEYRVEGALKDIEGFSHLWLLFDFSESHRASWSPTVRPPRLGGKRTVGVFASRSPFRPNSIGLSSVRLLSVEDTPEGKVLIVDGADLLDGTPIYDIKPYIRFSDSHEDAVCGYADQMFGYKLKVIYPDGIFSDIEPAIVHEIISCLEQDPRPAYDNDGSEYGMRISDYDVKFKVNEDVLRITLIERK